MHKHVKEQWSCPWCSFMNVHACRGDERSKCYQMIVKNIRTPLLLPTSVFSIDLCVFGSLHTATFVGSASIRDHRPATTVTVSSTFSATLARGGWMLQIWLCYRVFFSKKKNVAFVFFFFKYVFFKYCWVVKQPRYGKKCAKWEMYI